MPTFKFHCDRDVPGTSCVPMLAALGAASLGFEVTYGRTDPDPSPPGSPNMMPDFLAGVDVARLPHDCEAADPPARCGMRAKQGLEDGRVVRILDVPLTAWDVRQGDGAAFDCLVAGSLPLSLLERDPAPIRIACDAIGRNGLRRTWDMASSSWRFDVPALTNAEMASLLRGVPMPRPTATASELARMILGSSGMRHPAAATHAWPTASRRPAQVRNRPLPAQSAR